jgi:triphosphatase
VGKHDSKNGHHPSADAPAADLPLAVAGAAILRQQYEKLRAVEAGTRLGEDVEALHQMRVATARLRVALRLFVTDAVREPFASLEADSREFAHALGAVRDLDVFRDELRSRAEAIPADAPAIGSLLAAIEHVRAQRRHELVAVLDGPVVQRLWDRFPNVVDSLERTANRRVTVRGAAPRLLKKRLAKVIGSVDGVEASTSTELHQVRIRCKRLRYTGEFFKPWFDRKVEPIIKIAGSLQDTLGALHDGDVMPESLQALIETALAGGGSATVSGYELTRAILTLIQDRHRQRDGLLVRYRELMAELRAVGRDTRIAAP